MINWYETRTKIDNYLRDHYASKYIIRYHQTIDNSIFYKIYDIENDENFWVEFSNNGDFINAIYTISPDSTYNYYKNKGLI